MHHADTRIAHPSLKIDYDRVLRALPTAWQDRPKGRLLFSVKIHSTQNSETAFLRVVRLHPSYRDHSNQARGIYNRGHWLRALFGQVAQPGLCASMLVPSRPKYRRTSIHLLPCYRYSADPETGTREAAILHRH